MLPDSMSLMNLFHGGKSVRAFRITAVFVLSATLTLSAQSVCRAQGTEHEIPGSLPSAIIFQATNQESENSSVSPPGIQSDSNGIAPSVQDEDDLHHI